MAGSPRSLVVTALAGASLLLLAGCGEDASGAQSTLGTVATTSYVVEPPVATTAPPPTAAPTPGAGAEGQVSPTEQIYTVVGGDSVYRIAELHGIGPDVLANYNSWAEGINHPLQVGDQVKIPPDSQIPGTGTADTSSSAGSTDTSADTDTSPDTGGDTADDTADDTESSTESTDATGVACEHTIASGENPSKVANQYDITVDELIAANPGGVMDTFLVGAKLNIPGNGNC